MKGKCPRCAIGYMGTHDDFDDFQMCHCGRYECKFCRYHVGDKL